MNFFAENEMLREMGIPCQVVSVIAGISCADLSKRLAARLAATGPDETLAALMEPAQGPMTAVVAAENMVFALRSAQALGPLGIWRTANGERYGQ